MRQGLYLFCLARRDRLHQLDCGGIDDSHPLNLQCFRDVAVIWSAVSLDDFQGPEAEARMRDLAWLVPRVLHHEMVVESAMRHSGILPARFGTIFSCWESLEKVLRRHHEAISSFLDQAAGRQEWAVKVYWDQGRAKEVLLRERLVREEQALARLSPGNRYLHEQRLRKGLDHDARRELREACRRVEAALREYARDFRRRDLLSLDNHGDGRELVQNWAFWVPYEAAGLFKAGVEKLEGCYGAQGFALESSGPWPPYSFSPWLETGAGT